MTALAKTLGLKEGITLAVGSIVGSGILFLPSLTFMASGNDVGLVWIFATLICIPLLYVFAEMAKASPDARGIEGFISMGLGPHVGAAIPIIFLGTVTIGMPSAAVIAGQYVSRFTQVPWHGPFTAYSLVMIGIVANLGGVKLGSKINGLVAVVLFAMGGSLVVMTTPAAIPHYHVLKPNFNMGQITAGMILAFWAYAGFENLTFIASEFKNPRRDFLISMIVALLICGLLYFGLSINYAALIGTNPVDPVVGLSQLTALAGLPSISSLFITIFAFCAVAINMVSWTWGISRLIFSSAEHRLLPFFLAKLDNGIPKRATLALATIFFINTTIAYLSPNTFQKGLVVVSTNFVFIYFLCLSSYFIHTKVKTKKVFSAFITLALLGALTSSGLLLIYPLILCLGAAFFSVRRSTK